MIFYTCYNNGVRALVSEGVLADINKAWAIQQVLNDADHKVQGRDYSTPLSEGLCHIGTPTFTFVYTDRFVKSPWFTGDNEFLDALCKQIVEDGGRIESSSFHVPFSNGCEIGVHGDRAMASELAYVTTEQQFFETFGVTRDLIRTKYLPTTREIRVAFSFGDNYGIDMAWR